MGKTIGQCDFVNLHKVLYIYTTPENAGQALTYQEEEKIKKMDTRVVSTLYCTAPAT